MAKEKTKSLDGDRIRKTSYQKTKGEKMSWVKFGEICGTEIFPAIIGLYLAKKVWGFDIIQFYKKMWGRKTKK